MSSIPTLFPLIREKFALNRTQTVLLLAFLVLLATACWAVSHSLSPWRYDESEPIEPGIVI